MNIIKTRYKIACECGACRKMAEHTIVFDKVGLGKCLHICSACTAQLKTLLRPLLSLPKTESEPVETVTVTKPSKESSIENEDKTTHHRETANAKPARTRTYKKRNTRL
ncbi:MAG: hypothetical protein FWD76_05750 [Firmicutes bacterium]|nr:hypothetical protein [Bacillota bacterium]